jgi:hypothetical protein
MVKRDENRRAGRGSNGEALTSIPVMLIMSYAICTVKQSKMRVIPLSPPNFKQPERVAFFYNMVKRDENRRAGRGSNGEALTSIAAMLIMSYAICTVKQSKMRVIPLSSHKNFKAARTISSFSLTYITNNKPLHCSC